MSRSGPDVDACQTSTTRRLVSESTLEEGQKGGRGLITGKGWWKGCESGERGQWGCSVLIPVCISTLRDVCNHSLTKSTARCAVDHSWSVNRGLLRSSSFCERCITCRGSHQSHQLHFHRSSSRRSSSSFCLYSSNEPSPIGRDPYPSNGTASVCHLGVTIPANDSIGPATSIYPFADGADPGSREADVES